MRKKITLLIILRVSIKIYPLTIELEEKNNGFVF